VHASRAKVGGRRRGHSTAPSTLGTFVSTASSATLAPPMPPEHVISDVAPTVHVAEAKPLDTLREEAEEEDIAPPTERPSPVPMRTDATDAWRDF
jgi:hypothetical protein